MRVGVRRWLMPPAPRPAPGRRRCRCAATPQPPPRRRSSWASVPRTRAPDAPSGWPSAIAPPLGLTFSGSSSVHSRVSASDCEANASLSSTTSTSSQPIPARSSARFAGLDRARCRTRRGRRRPRRATTIAGQRLAPDRLARRASSPSSIAPAPSLSGEALPAVTVPSSTNAGLSFASFSTRVSGADPLVALELGVGHRARPSRRRSRRPTPRAALLVAAHGERVLRLARDAVDARPASRRSRRARSSTARASRGLTIRQPSVVECSVSCARGKPRSGLSSTHGARLIDSTPPTTTSEASPVSIGAAGLRSRPRGSSRTGG